MRAISNESQILKKSETERIQSADRREVESTQLNDELNDVRDENEKLYNFNWLSGWKSVCA